MYGFNTADPGAVGTKTIPPKALARGWKFNILLAVVGVDVGYVDKRAVLPGGVEDENVEVEATFFASNVGYGEIARRGAELLAPRVAPFADIGRENITLFFVRWDIGDVFIVKCESAEKDSGRIVVTSLFAVLIYSGKVV